VKPPLALVAKFLGVAINSQDAPHIDRPEEPDNERAIRRGRTRSFETFAETRFDPELRRVRLEVGDDLRSRRIDSDLARKGESRQSRSRLRRVEAQTVVMPAPSCADERLRLDQNERDVSLRQTGRRRQTGRSGADDQHITAFHER